jgi:DNA modification methylase
MTTLAEIGNIRGSSNAITRWATFGPYYAMFPIDFAFDVVNKYSKKGDYIIDPFAGRFSSVYAGSVLGRNSVGIEINPVGWLYGKGKLNPAKEKDVRKRLQEIYSIRDIYKEEANDLPEFFQICYNHEVLKFLLSAKNNLNWKYRKTDWTLMSIILVSLHGKLGEGLSNQLRQTKSMGLNYSIKWWKENGYETPPNYNPYEVIEKKIEWRFKKGIPDAKAKVYLADSTKKMSEIVKESEQKEIKYSLLFTSPPYHSVVDYHADQWLRLWMLKEDKSEDRFKKRFNSKEDYEYLLDNVFGKCAKIMEEKSTIFVRTDVRKYTQNLTLRLLKKHFPEHKLEYAESEVKKKNQTELFNNKSIKKELDIKLTN